MRRLMLSFIACIGIVATSGCGTSVQIEPGFVILDTSPSGGAVNVDPQVELFVVLSNDIASDSLSSVTLADGEGNAVEAAVTLLEGDGRIMSVMPTTPLNRDTAYVMSIAGTLKSATGETLDANIIKRFRTAP